MHSDREYVTGMLKAGSSGYLLKDSAFQELVDAILFAWYPGEQGGNGKLETARHRSYWHDFAEKNLFGIEIDESRVVKRERIFPEA